MSAVACHTWACLRRDSGLLLVAGLVLGAALTGAFLGGTTLVEGRANAMILAGSAARLALVGGLAALVTTHLDRLRQGRELERLATLPVSALGLMVGFWLGWMPLAVALSLLAGAVPLWLGATGTGLVPWTGSMVLEAAVLVAFALFAGVTLRRGVALAVTLCLYAFARLSGLLLAVAHARAEAAGIPWAAPLLTGLSLCVPPLDLLARSAWLSPAALARVPLDAALGLGLLARVAGTVVLVLGLGAWDLRRSARG